MTFFPDQRGSALVFTLLVMTVVVLLGTALLTMAQTEVRMAYYQYKDTAAFYLADAGLQLAQACLEENPHMRGQIPKEEFPVGLLPEDARLSVSIDELGENRLKVTSVGEKAGVKQTLESHLLLIDHNQLFAWEETIFAGEDVEVKGAGQGKGPMVEGGIRYGGEIRITGSDAESITAIKNESQYPFPTLPPEVYWSLADRVVNPNQLGADQPVEGIVYVEGDVIRSKDIVAGQGIIVVAGKLELTGNASLNGNFFIIAEEGVKLTGTTTLTGIIYTPQSVDIGGNADVVGRVLAGDMVRIHGSVKVTGYDGESEDLLVGLPTVLVIQEKWYRR